MDLINGIQNLLPSIDTITQSEGYSYTVPETEKNFGNLPGFILNASRTLQKQVMGTSPSLSILPTGNLSLPSAITKPLTDLGFQASQSFENISLPSVITKPLVDLGTQASKSFDDRFKFDFNSSNLANMFPTKMTMKTEMNDVFIYAICAGVALVCLIGIVIAVLYQRHIMKRSGSISFNSFDNKADKRDLSPRSIEIPE